MTAASLTVAGHIRVGAMVIPPAGQIKAFIGYSGITAAMPQPVRQFVLLLHSLSDSRHWDLMLDTGDFLATWQLHDDPAAERSLIGGGAIVARRLADHRRAYLDYEGPLTGNRGSVTRVDRGEYFVLLRQERLWTVRLAGEVLRGTFLLSSTSATADEWSFQCLDR